MKKLLFILSIVFTILTFAGAFYVITSNGEANAGYAVIPMGFSLACSTGFISLKNKENKKG